MLEELCTGVLVLLFLASIRTRLTTITIVPNVVPIVNGDMSPKKRKTADVAAPPPTPSLFVWRNWSVDFRLPKANGNGTVQLYRGATADSKQTAKQFVASFSYAVMEALRIMGANEDASANAALAVSMAASTAFAPNETAAVAPPPVVAKRQCLEEEDEEVIAYRDKSNSGLLTTAVAASASIAAGRTAVSAHRSFEANPPSSSSDSAAVPITTSSSTTVSYCSFRFPPPPPVVAGT